VGWGYSKLATVGVIFLFAIAQAPLILKHMPESGGATPKE
jgi:hypothetical protein